MGSALSVFNDFATATGPAYITGPEQIVNEATKQNYLLRRYLRGKGPEEILQGGKTIKDTILFDEDSTFQYYQPNATFTWKNPQVLTEWAINRRFAVDHMSWTDAEIELNIGGGLSRSARHQAFKKLLRVKEQRLWTSLLNGMEDMLFATPNEAQMEDAAGTRPYSIPCFITEDGLAPRNADGTKWTGDKIQNISPTTQSKWRNQVEYYDHEARGFASTDSREADLLSAFDKMYLSVRFEAPPTRQEYFESDNLYRQFIACSKKGILLYEQLMRSRQDRFAAPSMQDPAFLKPTYGGIELEYVASLDTAKLYAENDLSGNLAAENGATLSTTDQTDGDEEGYAGPRYYWINANYITPVFHTKRYLTKHPVLTHPNQPFTHVQPIDCWMNMVCRSRRRQGIIAPSEDVTVAG